MSGSLRFEQWVPAPLEDVFAFFSDPANLPRLMPPALRATLVGVEIVPPGGAAKGAAGVGSRITVSVRLFPFLPVRTLWVARITEFEADRHFADIQAKGPFRRFQHRHEFERAVRNGRDGTLVRDLLEYEIGFGPAGRSLQRLYVDRQMRRTFAHRQGMLEKLLSARK